jgi:hypothetical protein
MDTTKYEMAYRGPYENALAELGALMERLEDLDVEREAVITRIGEVKEGIGALAPLVKANPIDTHPHLFPDDSVAGADLGLTDAIRRVLANSAPKRLTPVGVRTGLAAIGFQTKSKNILPSIHTVLKRLEKNEEITSKTEEDGRTWYSWKEPPAVDPKLLKELFGQKKRNYLQEAAERMVREGTLRKVPVPPSKKKD